MVSLLHGLIIYAYSIHHVLWSSEEKNWSQKSEVRVLDLTQTRPTGLFVSVRSESRLFKNNKTKAWIQNFVI